MAIIERFRQWYEHEKASNRAMLRMLDSVPLTNRADPRFKEAVTLAAHLAACRENWLDRMIYEGQNQVSWWPEDSDLMALPTRYESMEAKWSEYLNSLTDDLLDADFAFPVTGGSCTWNIEGQIVQLLGHGPYHRGQVALLVKQLDGKPEDTDYLYWAFEQQPDRWRFEADSA